MQKNSVLQRLSPVFLTFCLISLCSCLKTSAEIQRDQEVEQAMVSARESNSILAELTTKNKDLQDQMSLLHGKVEELQQKLNKDNNPSASGVSTPNSEQFLKLLADVEELKTKNANLQKAFEENSEQTKKLENVLKGLTTTPIDASSFKSKDKNKEFTVEDAEKMLIEKKFNEVLSVCKEVLSSKATDGKKNRCRYAQGLAYKELKQFDEGLLSLSQIYTDWPKSSLAPNALLEIGKILKLKGQGKESQLMYKKLINEYPKSDAAKEAKKTST